jgi:hypothetical protein
MDRPIGDAAQGEPQWRIAAIRGGDHCIHHLVGVASDLELASCPSVTKFANRGAPIDLQWLRPNQAGPEIRTRGTWLVDPDVDRE